MFQRLVGKDVNANINSEILSAPFIVVIRPKQLSFISMCLADVNQCKDFIIKNDLFSITLGYETCCSMVTNGYGVFYLFDF